VGTNRWEVSDASGRPHVVSVNKGLLGAPSLRVDGRQVMHLAGDGIVAFEVAGRQARLSPQPGGDYDFSVGSVVQGDPANVATTMPMPAADAATLRLTQQRDRAASWFYWIGGLSLVNTVLLVLGSDYSFASGLGLATYLAVVVYIVAGESMLWLSIFLSVPLVAGLFLLGRKARSGATWPFAFGAVAYALDLLLVLTLTDWIGVAIHVFALVGFVSGLRASRALRRAGSAATSSAAV
jgi:hypothetical protein